MTLPTPKLKDLYWETNQITIIKFIFIFLLKDYYFDYVVVTFICDRIFVFVFLFSYITFEVYLFLTIKDIKAIK